MEENKIKVYVQINENNNITEIESSISSNYIDFSSGWIQIDEGSGDRYAHAQGNYLDKHLRDIQGRYSYKLINNKIIELTEEKKEKLPPQHKRPTEVEQLQKQLLETQDLVLQLQEQILLNNK
ncbi:hypothetical protein UT300005_31770 [Clostridium sp. CTA-5]